MQISEFETGLAYHLRFTHGQGTCFAWIDARGTYFVTAAHLIRGAAAGDVIEFKAKDAWTRIILQEVQFAADGADIAVFSAENFIIGVHPDLKIPVAQTMLQLAQDVVFLGYPLGMTNTYPRIGYEAPLVRKASFSGVTMIKGVVVLIFDGFNNPGYSGGPIFAEVGGETTLGGVVSGYSYDRPLPVYRKLPDGDEERLADTYVKPNSGMIYAHSWDQVSKVVELLSTRNPLPPPGATPPAPPNDTKWLIKN